MQPIDAGFGHYKVTRRELDEAKRLMSCAILSRLKRRNETKLIVELKTSYQYERKVLKIHLTIKNVYTYNFMIQKLNYMHSNSLKADLVKRTGKIYSFIGKILYYR